MKKDPDTTTIQVKKATRARLDREGDIHVESYDTIVNRILDQAKSKKNCSEAEAREFASRINQLKKKESSIKGDNGGT